MTDSQGGTPLPGTSVPGQYHIGIRRGEGEKAGPAKLPCHISSPLKGED
jgi:hypothetical protein